ncbi:MAG: DedA family protein [Leptospiraceae bacterium]|nr:DedA family protein [Leptospiraceae bacterium]MDW8306776.1 DedA family protein [Leptospiraceae bacterium]
MTSYLEVVHPAYYGFFIGFSAFIENIFPPYPGDTVIVFAGYLLAKRLIGLSELVISVYAGNLAGASIMYYFGEHVLDWIQKISRGRLLADFDKSKIDTTKKWFDRYGIWTVIFSRFSAGIRFFVAIAAGLVRMPFFLFLLCFALATTLWNALLIYGGYALGENWEKMLEILRIYNIVVIGLLASIIVVVLLWRHRVKRVK